jgi:hypothetical protein
LRSAGQHDARQVVVAEYGRLLPGSLRHDQAACAHLDEALARHECHPVIGVVAGRVGLGEHADASLRVHALDERLDLLCAVVIAATGVKTAAPEGRILIHQQHRGALLGCSQCRSQSRRSGPDHEHVAEVVALGCDPARRREVHGAEAAQVAEHALPARKQPLVVKRLVIEAHREKR